MIDQMTSQSNALPSYLYHASTRIYLVGNVIGPYTANTFVGQCVKDDNHKRAEETLEEFRNGEHISRSSAIYCFDKPAHCKAFGDAEHRPDTFFIYKVTATQQTGHPIALVDHIYRLYQQGAGEGKINASAKEYGSPVRGWTYLEYLCSTCKVVSVIDPNHYIADMADHLSREDRLKDSKLCKDDFALEP